MSKEKRFRQLLDAHSARIRRTCRGYVDDTNDADDLFQEVCLHVWQSLDGFRQQAAVSTWLYRITVNTCLMYVRKRNKLAVTRPAEWPDVADEPPDDTDENLTRLRVLIASLPDADRLLMLLYLEDLTYQEIADTLGQTVSNIGVRLNRIKHSLSEKFIHHGRF